MRKVLGIIVCVALTGCQALRVDQGGDGASVVSLRLGTLHPECYRNKKTAPCDDNGTCEREGVYEGYLTSACPQAMAPSVGPAHTVQAIIQGPDGPSVAYLQIPDGEPNCQCGYGGGMPRMQPQPPPVQVAYNPPPPVVQTAYNPPPPVDDPVRTMQNELTQRICQQVIDLKQKVQDLTAQAKNRPEPVRDGAVEAMAMNVAALNQQVSKLNEGLTSLKTTQERAAAPSPAPQAAPAPVAAAPASSAVRPASAQSVQPPALLAADEPIDLTQSEINRLVTQCLCELKTEIRELNARLAKFPGASKSGE